MEVTAFARTLLELEGSMIPMSKLGNISELITGPSAANSGFEELLRLQSDKKAGERKYCLAIQVGLATQVRIT